MASLAPPITAVFLLGLFFRRINATGAVLGLAIGFALGLAKLAAQALAGAGWLDGVPRLAAFGRGNFLYFSGLLFLVSVVIVVAGSLLRPAPPAAAIAGLTFGTIAPAVRSEDRASWGAVEVAGTLLVLGLVGGIYLYFSFWLG